MNKYKRCLINRYTTVAHELEPTETRIGWEGTINHMVLDNRKFRFLASKTHAVISVESNERVLLRNVSSNGTFVLRMGDIEWTRLRSQPWTLEHGDWVAFGGTEFVDMMLGPDATTYEENPYMFVYDSVVAAAEVGAAGGSDDNSVPGPTTCPICLDHFDKARVLSCGHVFCGACIARHLEKDRTCPCCRRRLHATDDGVSCTTIDSIVSMCRDRRG